MELGSIFFWFFALLGILGAVGMISSRNPVYSVLYLIVNFFAIAGLYLTLHAEFLAIVQVVVYAGAILVLFLFVIMLLDLDRLPSDDLQLNWRRGLGFLAGTGFLTLLILSFQGLELLPHNQLPKTFTWGKAEPIGKVLFTKYLIAFELISVILLASLIGALVIAREPGKDGKAQTEAEKMGS